eukprot:290652_1
MNALPLTKEQIRRAAWSVIIIIILWIISSTLMLIDYDSYEGIKTQQQIIKFHELNSTQNKKIEFAVGSILGYLTIPFYLYKLFVIKKYLTDYFCCKFGE